MYKINDNYLKLPGSYLFSTIGKKVAAYSAEHPEKQIRSMLKRSDARHMRNYRFYTGKEWGRSENYDITINSASYGISGSVALLIGMLEGEIDY